MGAQKVFATVGVAILAGSALVGGSLLRPEGASAAGLPTTWGSAVDIAAPGQPAGFNAVSCTGAGDCTAVGEVDTGNGTAIAATDSDGTWGTATAVTTPGDAGAFWAVDCTGVGDCTAVGSDGNGEPVSDIESDGSWGTATEVPAPGSGGVFFGVSCSDSQDCTAVGADDNGQPFYSIESDGSWGSATETTAPGGGGVYAGVSCTEAGDCTAVGGDFNGLPFYVIESGGSWGPAVEVNAQDQFGGFSAVSCIDPTDCTAVGQQGGAQSMYDSESAGVWNPPADVQSPQGFGQFNGVSCTDTTDCTTVGQDAQTLPDTASDKLIPTTAWHRPHSVAYGTPLGAGQLDAGASVLGTFVYAPAAGTVLPVGTDSLSATFYPSDAGTYAPTTVSTTMVVKPTATTTTLSFTSPVVVGSEGAADFLVTVDAPTGITPAGIYKVDVGTHLICKAELSGSGTGSCTLTPSQLRAGTYSVKAVFVGLLGFNGSRSPAQNLTISSGMGTESARMVRSDPSLARRAAGAG